MFTLILLSSICILPSRCLPQQLSSKYEVHEPNTRTHHQPNPAGDSIHVHADAQLHLDLPLTAFELSLCNAPTSPQIFAASSRTLVLCISWSSEHFLAGYIELEARTCMPWLGRPPLGFSRAFQDRNVAARSIVLRRSPAYYHFDVIDGVLPKYFDACRVGLTINGHRRRSAAHLTSK